MSFIAEPAPGLKIPNKVAKVSAKVGKSTL